MAEYVASLVTSRTAHLGRVMRASSSSDGVSTSATMMPRVLRRKLDLHARVLVEANRCEEKPFGVGFRGAARRQPNRLSKHQVLLHRGVRDASGGAPYKHGAANAIRELSSTSCGRRPKGRRGRALEEPLQRIAPEYRPFQRCK